MTSLQTSIRQAAPSDYYIPLADLRGPASQAGVILAYRSDVAQFSTNAWAAYPLAGGGRFSTLVAAAGVGLLKDMGKTIISANRTFRKIQLVANGAGSSSTFGVAGDVTTSADYLTGYIELGFEGTGAPAKVARFGR
jgi:hypothetical protein